MLLFISLDAVDDEEHDKFNEISSSDDESNEVKQLDKKPDNKHKHYEAKTNEVREKHREIRENFDRLERKTAEKSSDSDFIEPKVQGLWKIAQAGNFSADELASIKVELHHFEAKFLKLRTMHAEHALTKERNKDLKPGDKYHDKLDELERGIQKQSRKVEKLQEDIEKKLQPKSEL
jgi:alpha-2-macroglobulin receptor-associated protein